ncbi:tRNA (adenosine(37)-N6)-threonylcarbamoyltransferase complex transferase subunit TsaD [Patescibacteria group bacterium]|nr:MAG: tRNA (adenosine(37)-N6)-threonylcarbamoyltransferase complex transferase subunit TsaD [Patescibacteria group bacterium]
MRILGIETSCDETSLALVRVERGRFVVEKMLTASQVLIHKKYGGVVPEVAAREHAETIFPVLAKMVNPKRPNVDAIAVTAGPGLITSLRVGVDVGRTLAWLWKKPLVGVNHIEGHIASNWLTNPRVAFPAVALIVSGGHTELLRIKKLGQYELMGATRDDAAGEAFDKTAQLLGLDYPGGPAVSKLAQKGNPRAVKLPRPMIASGDFDFSFSGLKTAVRSVIEAKGKKPKPADVCASFEEAVCEVLVTKTIAAAKKARAKTALLGGGVAANRRLRTLLAAAIKKELPKVRYVEPDLAWTSDNAAMIVAAGYFALQGKRRSDPLMLAPDAGWELGR